MNISKNFCNKIHEAIEIPKEFKDRILFIKKFDILIIFRCLMLQIISKY